MKKVLFFAVAALSFVACNNANKNAEAEEAAEEAVVEVVEENVEPVDSVAPDSVEVVEAAAEAVQQ